MLKELKTNINNNSLLGTVTGEASALLEDGTA